MIEMVIEVLIRMFDLINFVVFKKTVEIVSGFWIDTDIHRGQEKVQILSCDHFTSLLCSSSNYKAY
jgi:hypothetical protein